MIPTSGIIRFPIVTHNKFYNYRLCLSMLIQKSRAQSFIMSNKMRSHKGILPREGLYIDPIVIMAKRTLLHPIFAICVFICSRLSVTQWPKLQSPILYGTILSLALWVNDFLSHKARNNWVTDPTWDWSKEIVVVTGGSSGIGASAVERLAADGVRVIVIDIVPTTSNSSECSTSKTNSPVC